MKLCFNRLCLQDRTMSEGPLAGSYGDLKCVEISMTIVSEM